MNALDRLTDIRDRIRNNKRSFVNRSFYRNIANDLDDLILDVQKSRDKKMKEAKEAEEAKKQQEPEQTSIDEQKDKDGDND